MLTILSIFSVTSSKIKNYRSWAGCRWAAGWACQHDSGGCFEVWDHDVRSPWSAEPSWHRPTVSKSSGSCPRSTFPLLITIQQINTIWRIFPSFLGLVADTVVNRQPIAHYLTDNQPDHLHCNTPSPERHGAAFPTKEKKEHEKSWCSIASCHHLKTKRADERGGGQGQVSSRFSATVQLNCRGQLVSSETGLSSNRELKARGDTDAKAQYLGQFSLLHVIVTNSSGDEVKKKDTKSPKISSKPFSSYLWT